MGDNVSRESTPTDMEQESNTAKKPASSASPIKDGPPAPPKRERKPKEEPEPPFKSKVALPANMEPTFFIGGGNGVGMIDETLSSLGWRRTKDKTDDNFKLKWTELKSQINYNKFREGEQIVNHIPNCNLLTNKLGLLNTLQEHEQACANGRRKAPKLDFIPETYRLDDPKDREQFIATWQEGETWICKPTGRNQGKGIFLVRNSDEVKTMIQEQEDKKEDGKPVKPLNRVIQRYIHNPLLIDGKKFDIRCYMLVASCVPYLVLYHSGYVRLSMVDYDNDTDNLVAHLTNQFIQKKDPNYQEKKEDTAWTFDKFNDYLNNTVAPEKGLQMDWLHSVFDARAKQILTYCFNSVKHKFSRRMGYFDLYGIDFMIDDNMKVWLIEVNVNPCLAINCEALKTCVPPIVKETIYIVVECFEKARKNRPILPLSSQKNFEIIHNGCGKPQGQGASPMRPHNPREKRSYSASPVRRYQSPTKDTSGEPNHSRSGPYTRNALKPTQTSQDQAKIAVRATRSGALPTQKQESAKGKEMPKTSNNESDVKKGTEAKNNKKESKDNNANAQDSKETPSSGKDVKETESNEKQAKNVSATNKDASTDEEKNAKDKPWKASTKERDGTRAKPVLLSLSKVNSGTNNRSGMVGRESVKKEPMKKDLSPKPDKKDLSPKPDKKELSPKPDKKDVNAKPEKKMDVKPKSEPKVEKKLATKEPEKDKKELKKDDSKGKSTIRGNTDKDSKEKVDVKEKDKSKGQKVENNGTAEKADASKDLKKDKPEKSEIKKEKTDVSKDVKKDKNNVANNVKVETKEKEKSDIVKGSKKNPMDKAKDQGLKLAKKTRGDNTNVNNSKSQENAGESSQEGPNIPQVEFETEDDDTVPPISFAPPTLSEADRKALKLNLEPPKIKPAHRMKSPYTNTKPASIKLRMSHNHDPSLKGPRPKSRQAEDNRGS